MTIENEQAHFAPVLTSHYMRIMSIESRAFKKPGSIVIMIEIVISSPFRVQRPRTILLGYWYL